MCNNGGNLNDAVEIQQKIENDPSIVDCSKCLEIPQAFCLASSENNPNEVRMDFNDMIEKMTSESDKKVCSCAEGYLPIYNKTNGALIKCHDPIIKTATIGGRCLVQEHCRGLTNSVRLLMDTSVITF